MEYRIAAETTLHECANLFAFDSRTRDRFSEEDVGEGEPCF